MRASSDNGRSDESTLRRRAVLLVTLFFLSEGLLSTGYFHFGARARGSDLPFLDSLISELTGSLAGAVVFFAIVLPAARRWPLRGPSWPRHVLAHAGALVVYSVAKTLVMWGTRLVLFPVAGLGAYNYGDMLYRFPMEFSDDVISYAILLGLVHAWDAWRSLRDRELREARLEANLTQARLQALQGQLQPHFLFNTLNVISSVMYDDPERADRLISRLSDLLRTSLGVPDRPEIALEQELHILGEYVEIMRARYGERLVVTTHVDAAARESKVPVFLLQPLVENAIEHGLAKRAGEGRIEVRAEREGDALVLRVNDDGPGIDGDPSAAFGKGVGLTNTRERLRHLYGPAAAIRLAHRPGGGLSVEVVLPFVAAGETMKAESLGRESPAAGTQVAHA
ncbi:MAG: sensor histidine kinase [Longimicrobiales bacterium]